MNAVSLFSGVGGFELGFERAGIHTVLQAERDPWCNEVLARHWPETERVTDVRDVGFRRHSAVNEDSRRDCADARRRTDEGSAVDLVYGGFPCQDLSVAGKRAGLGGSRSGEWFEFERVVSELRPRWAVIENVPGLLSSNSGDDFAIILGALDELGFAVAWAVLDAQHFGVPQRRRRVFVVAGPTSRGVEQVLSLCEGCGGNPQAGRATGQRATSALKASTGDPDDNNAQAGRLIAFTIQQNDGGDHKRKDRPAGGMYVKQADQALTVGTTDLTAVIPAIAWALQERDAKGPDSGTKEGHLLSMAHGVRRLTPLECERLQGFPDNWTRYTADGREIADSHRYRMMGNAVAVPCAEWIGHRLMFVDSAS